MQEQKAPKTKAVLKNVSNKTILNNLVVQKNAIHNKIKQEALQIKQQKGTLKT